VSDLPRRIVIQEEGPREGFQIAKNPIPTGDKVSLIAALATTGLEQIQICSFVSPKLVPGWADAEQVVEQVTAPEGVAFTALWFSESGLRRALAFRDRLRLYGSISLAASEAFSRKNLNRDREGNLAAMRKVTAAHQAARVPVTRIGVQAAFGCNFQGDIAPTTVMQTIADGQAIADEADETITDITLADTMGWATPQRVAAVVGPVRERWPDARLTLHLHDTRGLGIANAYSGLRLGVERFDATVGGLGGCPFAAQPGAPGNIASEELALLAEEMGVETGVDIDALIEVGHLAERIVGHPLPSAALRGGSLASFRAAVSA
jgi:hydroxymethylglutaryl-CoA lyase